MKTLLRVDADPQQQRSIPRMLADKYIDEILDEDPEISLIKRDLAINPPPQIESVEDIQALYGSPDRLTSEMKEKSALSDDLIAEIFASDEIIIATPMYNMSVPGILKAWIDQVVRARKTFRFSDKGPVGLIKNKSAVLFTVSGGFYTDENAHLDFLRPYLVAILEFIGITDIRVISAEGLAVDEKTRENSISKAVAEAKALAHNRFHASV